MMKGKGVCGGVGSPRPVPSSCPSHIVLTRQMQTRAQVGKRRLSESPVQAHSVGALKTFPAATLQGGDPARRLFLSLHTSPKAGS